MKERPTVGTVPACSKGLVVSVDAVSVHQLAGIVGVVARLLEPDGEIGVIEALIDEFGKAAIRLRQLAIWLTGKTVCNRDNVRKGGRTYRINVSDISVVSSLSSEQRDSRRATQRHGTKVLVELGALFHNMLIDIGLVIERIEMQILVVRHDEDKVGLGVTADTVLLGHGIDCQQQRCGDDGWKDHLAKQ